MHEESTTSSFTFNTGQEIFDVFWANVISVTFNLDYIELSQNQHATIYPAVTGVPKVALDLPALFKAASEY